MGTWWSLNGVVILSDGLVRLMQPIRGFMLDQ